MSILLNFKKENKKSAKAINVKMDEALRRIREENKFFVNENLELAKEIFKYSFFRPYESKTDFSISLVDPIKQILAGIFVTPFLLLSSLRYAIKAIVNLAILEPRNALKDIKLSSIIFALAVFCTVVTVLSPLLGLLSIAGRSANTIYLLQSQNPDTQLAPINP